MSNLRDTILLNGKVYAVGNDAIMAPVFPLDIVKTSPLKTISKAHKKPQHDVHPAHKATKPHATAKHASAHKRQHSQTLMRRVVQKPVKVRVEVAEKPAKTKVEHKAKLFNDLPNSGRVMRAIETPRSRHVSRFNHTHVAVHIKRNVPLAVKAEPGISTSGQPDEIDMLISSLARN